MEKREQACTAMIPPASPYAKYLAEKYDICLGELIPTGRFGEIKARDVESYQETHLTRQTGKRVTPLASRVAEALGVNLETVTGSGHEGKIMRDDVLKAGSLLVKKETVAGSRRERISGMRRVVAERMLRSHNEIPSATITTKVDVTRLMELRKELIEQCHRKYSVNDMVLRAVALALTEHKEMLCNFEGDSVLYLDEINIGMAVSVGGGLIVPVIHHADKMSLDEISVAAKDLAVRARDNKLSVDEYKGSTFTISNLGMFGAESFTPIINQPDSAILGICAIEKELVLQEGRVCERQVMRLCITMDHRLMDGVQAASFNLAVKEYLENPMKLVM